MTSKNSHPILPPSKSNVLSIIIHSLHEGDVIKLNFRLDSPQKTRIKRTAVILRILGNKIGCRLITGAFDPELGFYVQDFKVLSLPFFTYR
jgi:hypothetical protein